MVLRYLKGYSLLTAFLYRACVYILMHSLHIWQYICPSQSFVCPQALVIAGISLQTANLYGYIHCKLEGQKSIGRITSRFFVTADVPKSKYQAGLSAINQEVSNADLLVLAFPGISS